MVRSDRQVGPGSCLRSIDHGRRAAVAVAVAVAVAITAPATITVPMTVTIPVREDGGRARTRDIRPGRQYARPCGGSIAAAEGEPIAPGERRLPRRVRRRRALRPSRVLRAHRPAL